MPGYIEDRGKGSYRLVVSNGYDDTGHRKKMTKTIKAKSHKDAEKLLALFVAEIEKGDYLGPTKETFKTFAEKWLKDYAGLQVEFKTIDRYRDMLNHAIYSEIGHLPLEKIKPPHLDAFYRKLSVDGARRDGGYLSATIRHHHNLIHVILDRAVKWQLIPSNPADKVDSPKRKTVHPATYYDEEQSTCLLSCLKDEPLKYQLALSIGITTALRRGEVIGLRWSDIDLENFVISVNQSYEYRRKEGSSAKSTKTPGSQQKVAFPPTLATLFKEYKEWQNEQKTICGDLWADTGYVFTQWNGEVMNPDTLTQYMPKFTAKYNLPHLDFKGLRHTCASLLIANGADVSVVSRHLRHAQKSTTLNIYTHEFNRANKEAADIIETALPIFKEEPEKVLKEKNVVGENSSTNSK